MNVVVDQHHDRVSYLDGNVSGRNLDSGTFGVQAFDMQLWLAQG